MKASLADESYAIRGRVHAVVGRRDCWKMKQYSQRCTHP